MIPSSFREGGREGEGRDLRDSSTHPTHRTSSLRGCCVRQMEVDQPGATDVSKDVREKRAKLRCKVYKHTLKVLRGKMKVLEKKLQVRWACFSLLL